MSITSTQIDQITGAAVRGEDNDKIGTVGQVYVDTDGSPVWATVKTGLFGTSESFVPLETADFDGKAVQVRYSKEFVKDAPRIESDGELSDAETDRLYDYYGLGSSNQPTQDDSRTTRDDSRSMQDTAPQEYDPNTAEYGTPVTPRDGFSGNQATTTEGRDTSGPTTDDAMTRSEERLHVGTQRTETGRAKLRKHIVTEQQTTTVPVSHDEVTVTREPIDASNMDAAMSGGDLTEEEHEVTLTADKVVTSKETVPVERVKLGTEQVTEQQQVTEDVRKEQIEIDDPKDRATR